MNIYHFKVDTGEYLSTSIAEADPEETRVQGKFVPLVPAYSTLKPIPEYVENEIPVYSSYTEQKTIIEKIPIYDDETGEIISYEEKEKVVDILIENWTLTPDYRKNFYKVDDNLTVDDIRTIGEQEGFYIVDKAVGELIKQNPDKYKIKDNQVIAKTDEEYQAELARREAEIQIQQIKTALYELDLQAIRPLRAILAGTQTEEDLEKIKEIETMAKELRIKIQPLKSL